VKDRHGKAYTAENFKEILEPLLENIKPSILVNSSNSHRELYEELSSEISTSFTL
jgi:hypothetical protein